VGMQAYLDMPIDDTQREEAIYKEREDQQRRGGGGGAAADGGNKTPRFTPRPGIISGADQLISRRDPSPADISSADTVLCIITIVSAINPGHAWTMPATSHLWNELEARASVPYDADVPRHRTVVASSTHTNRNLHLLSEFVRDVMLSQTECVTCVLGGPAGQTVPSDRTFWTVWNPSVPVAPEEQAAENLAAAEGVYEPQLPTTVRAFPGELLQPAPGLVGRQWPSETGKMPTRDANGGFDDSDF
jgi:hypothetical protein